MLQFDLLPIRQSLFACPRDELSEQCGIGFLRVLRLPAFMTQILQKIFDESLHVRRITEVARQGDEEISLWKGVTENSARSKVFEHNLKT